MYRNLCRAPSRSLSGHVCLSCRRQFHATRTHHKDVADDWFSNFNDLSTATDKDRASRKREAAERKEAELSRQNPTNDAQSRFAELRTNLTLATGPGKSRSSSESDAFKEGNTAAAASGNDYGDPASHNDRQTYESTLAKLLAKQDGGDNASVYTGEINDNDGSSDNTRNDTPAPEVQPQVRSRIASDLLGQESAARGQSERDTGSAAAVDDVTVGQGVINPSIRMYDSSSRGHLSIIGKSRMVKQRPKWGGQTAVPESTGSFKASFNSLRNADKVSPQPERPSTAESANPWGFASLRPNGGLTGLPSESEVQNQAKVTTSRPNDEPSTTESGQFQGRLGFKELKGMLIGADHKTKSKQMLDAVNNRATDLSLNKENALNQPSAATNGAHPSAEVVPSSSPPKQIHNPPGTGTARTRRVRQQQQRRKLKLDTARTAETAETDASDVSGAQEDSTQSFESDGRPLAEAMEGRQLAEAMRNDSESQIPEEERSEEADSGLPSIEAKELAITALSIPQPGVPMLSFGLDRVLFNPGVTSLQDRHSRVYNFDPYLEHIMPVEEFDFNALQQYKTSSQDQALSKLAKSYEKKYVGSTSSMTSTLSHFHYLLSDWRDLNLGMLSRQFPEDKPTFTNINRAPTAIFLRWKNGTYAIDADKEFDSGNILMMMGKSMEKLLTMSRSEYERYRKSDPREITEEERNAPEAYEYTTMGDFLMRSQLDAYDPRLPGTGMFDIKTRAIASIRMSTTDFKPMLGYEIQSEQGQWESYEREYYDMMRSTMLKYMLQARMGRMDGIFLAYHNVQRIFGFQYMPIAEIDRAIHGQIDRCLGDQEFKLSLDLLNKVMNQATAKFPGQSLRFHFETRVSPVTALYVFAEPMEEEEIDKIQSTSKEKIAEFERKMMGIEKKEKPSSEQEDATPPDFHPAESSAANDSSFHAPLYAATIIVASSVNGRRVQRPEKLRPYDSWTVEYLLKEMEDPADAWATYAQCKAKRKKALSHAIMTDDEGGAEAPEDVEPNYEMHEADGSLRKFESFYLEQLRHLAEQGRKFRRKLDRMEEGREKVLWREGAFSAKKEDGSEEEAEVTSEEPRIDGVDDYLRWMYKEKAAN